jgi:uncharacterized membrane protein YwzB
MFFNIGFKDCVLECIPGETTRIGIEAAERVCPWVCIMVLNIKAIWWALEVIAEFRYFMSVILPEMMMLLVVETVAPTMLLVLFVVAMMYVSEKIKSH